MVSKTPYEDVVRYLESVGYKILITEDKYKGVGKAIPSLCLYGHETNVYIKDMKKNGGKYCKKCFIEDKKVPYSEVLDLLSSIGYKSLITEKEYKGIKYPFRGECSKGHICEKLLIGDLKRGISCCVLCGNIKRIKTFMEKYGVTNSMNVKEFADKKDETNLERYGVIHPMQSEEIKDKTKQTNLERYGVIHPMQLEEIKNKTKQTNLERYGTLYPSQLEEIKEKTKQTNLERYGVIHPMQLEEIKEKTKQTNLERYGVIYPMQLEEIKEKTKQTNLERYGVIHPMQLEEIKEKTKQTNLERYGVINPMQLEEIKEKTKQTNLERYGVPYATQNPDIQSKIKKSLYSRKEYIFPKGKKIICQGYEPFCLDDLIKEGYDESHIITDNVPIISYEYEGDQKKYFPDIFIPIKNQIIEVKSIYTFEKNKDKNLLKAKACKQSGYNFEFRIYDRKGKIIEIIK